MGLNLNKENGKKKFSEQKQGASLYHDPCRLSFLHTSRGLKGLVVIQDSMLGLEFPVILFFISLFVTSIKAAKAKNRGI